MQPGDFVVCVDDSAPDGVICPVKAGERYEIAALLTRSDGEVGALLCGVDLPPTYGGFRLDRFRPLSPKALDVFKQEEKVDA